MSIEQTEVAMQAAGVATEVSQEVDYFGFEEKHTYTLPDGRQSIYFAAMNEGAKAAFQKLTSRDLRVQRSSGDALVKMDQAAERHALIQSSVTGWSLRRRNPKTDAWENAPFDGPNLSRFLKQANPKIIEELERAIRKANAWLMDELTVEEIDKEIENLREMREAAQKREEGKELSAS
jgi:hypothetical protein